MYVCFSYVTTYKPLFRYCQPMSSAAFSVAVPRCMAPTFGCCAALRCLLLSLDVWDLPLVVEQRCVVCCCPSMYGTYLWLLCSAALSKRWTLRLCFTMHHNTITKTHMTHHFTNISIQCIQFILVNSDMFLSTLKWKTVKRKIYFFLLNLYPSNASYSQGETVKDLLYLSPSRIDTRCADRTLSSWHPAV
jgi:hypothetical protein